MGLAQRPWRPESRGHGLSEGTLQLRDGGKALQDGLDTFYKEGIVKLTSALQEKVPQMLDRFRAHFRSFL